MNRGRFGLEKANKIQQYAKNSFGIILASSSLSLIIKKYIEQLKSFESSIAIFDAEIAKMPPLSLLLKTLPFISFMSAKSPKVKTT